MTIRTESRIAVAAAVDDAWAYLCDVARWAEWAPTVLECRVRGGGPLRPGAWIEQRARDLGWNHHRVEQVTAVDAPRTMAFAGTMAASPARWGMEFDSVDGGTSAMMWVEVELTGILRTVPAGMLRRQVQRVSDIEMAAIKTAVEGDRSEAERPEVERQEGAGSP